MTEKTVKTPNIEPINQEATTRLVSTVTRELGQCAGKLATTVCKGLDIQQVIALARLLAAATRKEGTDRTQAANDAREKEYGFDRDVVKLDYRMSRNQWRTRTEAAEHLTGEVNWWRKEFGQKQLPVAEKMGRFYAQSVYDWLCEADKEDGHKWRKGRPKE